MIGRNAVEVPVTSADINQDNEYMLVDEAHVVEPYLNSNYKFYTWQYGWHWDVDNDGRDADDGREIDLGASIELPTGGGIITLYPNLDTQSYRADFYDASDNLVATIYHSAEHPLTTLPVSEAAVPDDESFTGWQAAMRVTSSNIPTMFLPADYTLVDSFYSTSTFPWDAEKDNNQYVEWHKFYAKTNADVLDDPILLRKTIALDRTENGYELAVEVYLGKGQKNSDYLNVQAALQNADGVVSSTLTPMIWNPEKQVWEANFADILDDDNNLKYTDIVLYSNGKALEKYEWDTKLDSGIAKIIP